jgi:TolB-like protein
VAYLAAALALTHAEEMIAHAYGWPESVGQLLIAVLGIGLPVAVTLAWYHGHRATRHVTGAEATIIAILLLMGSGFLWLLVRPHEPAVSQAASERALAPSTSPAAPAIAARQTAPAPAAASGKPRLAILPFENLSPDPTNAFFTDGLHEEIISTLSNRAPDLDVISRTTMMAYRTPKPVEEIARELGATHVLQGSVRREGNRVRMTLQLINARIDQHVWSQDYDRTLSSALTLQTEVANEVASQLAVRLGFGAGAFTALTRDPHAYDRYLMAQVEGQRVTGQIPLEQLQKIEGFLSDAIARDPAFARAYAQRAGTYIVQFGFNYDSPQHAMPLAKRDLDAAERLAPDDPEVLFFKAIYIDFLERDPARAVVSLDAAGTGGLSPLLLALSAQTYWSAGRFDEAIRSTQRAIAIDPKNPAAYRNMVLAFLFTRRPADALREANIAAVEFPIPFQLWRSGIVWAHTGTGAPPTMGGAVPAATEITADVDADAVNSVLFPLRIEHRYREMADYLGRARAKTFRGRFTLGPYPVAELRGWTHLLLGDRAAAAQDAREVLDFVARTEQTKWNRAFLRILTAEAATFAGDKTRAVTAAGEAVRLSQSWFERQFVAPVAVSVYAWSGASDDAVSLLERFSTQIPELLELGPATIARDPLYTVPLAGNARYKALQARIEAKMAATKLE